MKKVNCILLVDDSAPDNFLHQRLIKKADVTHMIRITENGEEALDYLKNEGKYQNQIENPKPQIIFLDINMPKMNGFEFLEAYHELDADLKADLCIMMLTTSMNPEDKKKADDIDELNGYLNKPLMMQALTKIMNEYTFSA